MSDLNPESVLAILTAEAKRRFGHDRAAALVSELDGLARDLSRVALAPLPPDVEPGSGVPREAPPPPTA